MEGNECTVIRKFLERDLRTSGAPKLIHSALKETGGSGSFVEIRINAAGVDEGVRKGENAGPGRKKLGNRGVPCSWESVGRRAGAGSG